MRADTATSYSSSGDILRAHALAHRPEQLQSAKQNVLCLCAVVGGQRRRLLVTKPRLISAGSFAFDTSSPAGWGAEHTRKRGSPAPTLA